MPTDRWSDLLALAACLVGLAVILTIWPRRASRRVTPRDEQPGIAPPVAVKLDTIGLEPHWRIANRHRFLEVTIDIVAYRPIDSELPWFSEPIVEPVTLPPGRSTTLSSVIADPTLTHDVVVAWTLDERGAAEADRRTFRVPPAGDATLAPGEAGVAGPMRGLAVVYGMIAALLCVGAGAAVWRLIDDSSVSSGITALPAVGTEPEASPPSTAAEPAPAPTEAVPMTTEPLPTTTSPPTTAPRSTTSSTTSTTSSSTTSTSTSTTSTVPGPRVAITGRIDRCQFGPACLVASFRVEELPDEGNYVCEFADGSQFTFRYEGGGADDACTASGRDPSISIVVGLVRSETITRDFLNDEP